MQFKAESGAARRTRTDCAVVGIHENGQIAGSGTLFDSAVDGRIARIVKGGDFAGRLGESLPPPDLGKGPAARVLLVGLGSQQNWSRRHFRKALTCAAQAVLKTPAADAVVAFVDAEVPGTDAYDRARFVAEIFGQVSYQVPAIRSARKAKPHRLTSARVIVSQADLSDARRGLRDGAAIGAGASLTRDLANLPANVCTPTYLAREATRLARVHRSIQSKSLGEREMRRLGMGSSRIGHRRLCGAAESSL
jgi:leucyl aminopeptidase